MKSRGQTFTFPMAKSPKKLDRGLTSAGGQQQSGVSRSQSNNNNNNNNSNGNGKLVEPGTPDDENSGGL
jgi:hypothetical protein